jgi:hypothetical protein
MIYAIYKVVDGEAQKLWNHNDCEYTIACELEHLKEATGGTYFALPFYNSPIEEAVAIFKRVLPELKETLEAVGHDPSVGIDMGTCIWAIEDIRDFLKRYDQC